MTTKTFKSIDELLAAYANGQRQFQYWHFEEDESLRGLDLTGVEFRNCFLYLDFRDANLTNATFISCNMKTADFRGANLTHALIKHCLLESAMFKGAKVDNFRFEENYYWGMTTQPGDFERVFKESDEA